MARAEYTTGYPCAITGCAAPALHDVDYGHGYVHMCPKHSENTIKALWPQGLERTTTTTPEGIHRD